MVSADKKRKSSLVWLTDIPFPESVQLKGDGMTIKEAYRYFIEKYPNKKTCTISNLEDVFFIGVGGRGDFINDQYTIDKRSLVIKEINMLEVSKLFNRYSDEDLENIEMVHFN